MTTAKRHIAARLAGATLCAGFLYSGMGKPSPIRSGSSTLGDAVHTAGWPLDADIVLVVTDASLMRQETYQTYYATSYALYPLRVWLPRLLVPLAPIAALSTANTFRREWQTSRS